MRTRRPANRPTSRHRGRSLSSSLGGFSRCRNVRLRRCRNGRRARRMADERRLIETLTERLNKIRTDKGLAPDFNPGDVVIDPDNVLTIVGALEFALAILDVL